MAAPLDLCPSQRADSLTSAPDSQSLVNATREAETILAVGLADLLTGDRALDALGQVGEPVGQVDRVALSNYCAAAGEAMRIAREGSAERARSFLLGAMIYAEDAGDSGLQAKAAYRLALVSASLPVRPNARSARRVRSPQVSLFEPARRSGSQLPDVLVGPCFDLLRADLTDQSNWAVASEALQCAIEAAPAEGSAEPIARANLQLARITLAEAERRPADRQLLLGKAGEAALAGLPAAQSILDPNLRFELTARLIESGIDAGAHGDPVLLDALARIGDETERFAEREGWRFALMGRALLGAGERSGAAAYFRQAIFHESQAARPLRLPDWHLLLAQAEPEQRERHVMQAYEVLQSIRPILPRFDTVTEESNFQLRMLPVFTAAVDVQLDPANGNSGDGAILLAQQIVESFRQAEIQSAFGADCVPPREPVSLTDLRNGEILLYPILLEDRIELLYASKRAGEETRYRRFTSTEGAQRERIEQLVKDTAFSLGYGEDDSWEAGSTELYRLIIEPIEPLLEDGASLIIIPDGILRRLPFAALRAEDGTFLVEMARISVSPSLAYTQPGTDERGEANVLAASLSKPVELTRGSFGELRGTKIEGDIAAGLGDPSRSLGQHLENFQAPALRKALGERAVDILHLATHASFNGRSDRSFIVADGEAILLSELRELLGANQLRGELISLIILSACETALGDDQASMGLAGSAVQAGAESAVASLWEVDDAGTLELMTNFYRFYSEGQGKAEAMRNAQLALLREDNRFADPRIWAAFTLLGAWR